jgi:hypothetical protein
VGLQQVDETVLSSHGFLIHVLVRILTQQAGNPFLQVSNSHVADLLSLIIHFPHRKEHFTVRAQCRGCKAIWLDGSSMIVDFHPASVAIENVRVP